MAGNPSCRARRLPQIGMLQNVIDGVIAKFWGFLTNRSVKTKARPRNHNFFELRRAND
jgi:hypothetical protein